MSESSFAGWGIFLLLVLSTCFFATSAFAEPIARDDVPEPLRPWIDWALHGHEEARCPTFYGSDRRLCAWPSELTLTLDDQGGSFTQQWMAYDDTWVPLPGDARLWPHDVVVDGKPALLTPREGRASVRLAPGHHTIGGRFAWARLPEMLPIPRATGLLRLTARGQDVPFPSRDSEGRLWLQRREDSGETVGHVDVDVHRLAEDSIPLLLHTRIVLEVSGKGREIVLGPALPDDFVPLALNSPLPARLEADGHLRLQVRPGRWEIDLIARHSGPAEALTLRATDGPWDANEVWVFQAQNDLRLVSVEGVESIDPQQTDLPPDWKQLPAYLMRPASTMRLVERRRGDADPAPDQLALERTLWLDFDGGGYTLHDRITGVLTRSWRLEMPPPTSLGRVAVGGQDQLVTRLGNEPGAGVEIRQGTLQVDADSRFQGDVRDISAVSWSHAFDSVKAELRLPPGWRLLHAAGVDDVRPTWIRRWSLLDLFVVLITALAVARLFGWGWGTLALLAVGLTYTEPEAPQWMWPAALAGEALARVVPPGRFLRPIRLFRLAALVVLTIVAVPFMLQQVRQALYPALEHAGPHVSPSSTTEGPLAPPPGDEAAAEKFADRRVARRRMAAPESQESDAIAGGQRSYQSFVDPRAVVQTGPGLPDWQWNTVALVWSGPVSPTQRIRLALIPPWANLLLGFLRTLLVAALLARLWTVVARVTPPSASQSSALHGLARAALVAITLAAVAPARAADFPPAAMLDELRSRLLAPPECQPLCASIPRLRLEIAPATMRARLQVHASANTAVPLPGQALQWLPSTVLVDNQSTAVLSQGDDGHLWLYLDEGSHEVLLDGPLPARDTVQIPLPLLPHFVAVQVSGWTLEGLHEGGSADANLQLTRLASGAGGAQAPLQPGALPPFARVERTLALPLSWQVETRVQRLSPPGTALVLEVPLLPGESVTSADVRVVDGKALINMLPHALEVVWQSTLAETSPITLRAPEGVAWVEVWRLDASPVWHVDAKGIPEVHRAPADVRVREWRPWPGESVTLDVSRPEGVPGQALTIDRSELTVSPGLRSTAVILDLRVRSSRGTQHTITLPEGAELEGVSLDGASQPIRQEQRAVVLPIAPGTQQFELRWREPRGVTTRLTTPAVDLGVATVNATLLVGIPADRWILFAGGPRLGPAVLFWSILPVLLLLAFALGRVRTTPLRAHHWFLLGIGLTQVPTAVAAIVVGWLLALGWRRDGGKTLTDAAFDLLQIVLVAWTASALAALFSAIEHGLLGTPEMQIAGNGSHAGLLRWYQDRTNAVLPQAWVLSVPLLVYRLLMLAWALWIAQALLRWLRWGWECFGASGYWRPLRRRRGAAPTSP